MGNMFLVVVLWEDQDLHIEASSGAAGAPFTSPEVCMHAM